MFSLLKNNQAVALLLAASLTILSNTLISPALPGIQEAFKGQPYVDFIVPLLVTAPSLMVAIISPFAGFLADRFGRKPQLMLGIFIFAVTGTAGIWLDSLIAIFVSRLLLGVSVALVMTAQTALIGDYFTGNTRTKFMGLQIGATNFGGLIFVLLAGWLSELSAFYPFGIYLIALLYLPFIWKSVIEPNKNQNTDQPFKNLGSETGWPLTLSIIALIAALTLIGFYLIPTKVPFYLKEIGYKKPSYAGFMLASTTFAGGVISFLYSSVRKRLGRAVTPAVGFALMALGFSLLSFVDGIALILVSSLLIGAATGLLFPVFLSIALDVAPADRRGFASGTMTTAIFLGQFLSPIISQPIIGNFGFAKTFGLVAIIFVILGVLALEAFRKRKEVIVTLN